MRLKILSVDKLCIICWVLCLLFVEDNISAANRLTYGDTLRVPMSDIVQTTDPAMIESYDELQVSRQIHETLYRINFDGSVEPSLAQGFPKLDPEGHEMVIQLKPHLAFHDGTQITSSQVIATWERLVSKETGSPHWWMLSPIKGALEFRQGKSTKIAGLERINRLSFRIRLIKSLPDFIEVLAALPTAPLPRKWLNKTEPVGKHPPGSGPFVLSPENSQSQKLIFKPFLGHHQGRPFVDSLEIEYFSSPRSEKLAFEMGQLSLTKQRPSRKNESYRLVGGPLVQMLFLALNSKRAEKLPAGFQNAVTSAVDRTSLAGFLFGDHGIAVDELVYVEPSGESPDVLKGDPNKAKEYFRRIIMEERGIPPMLVFLVRKDNPLEKKIAQRIQLNLVDLGVVVTIVEAEPTVYQEKLRDGDFDFFIKQPIPFVKSVELQLVSVLATLQQEEGVAEFLQVQTEVSAVEDRNAIVREMARRYQIKLPWIPLCRYGQYSYVNDAVFGYQMNTNGQVDFGRVWINRRGARR
jgi:peptide/nickel transport system substrate-binding protein